MAFSSWQNSVTNEEQLRHLYIACDCNHRGTRTEASCHFKPRKLSAPPAKALFGDSRIPVIVKVARTLLHLFLAQAVSAQGAGALSFFLAFTGGIAPR